MEAVAWSCRRAVNNWNPSISGIITSLRTRSGGLFFALCKASWPFSAVKTSKRALNRRRTYSRMSRLSSTSSTVALEPLAGSVSADAEPRSAEPRSAAFMNCKLSKPCCDGNQLSASCTYAARAAPRMPLSCPVAICPCGRCFAPYGRVTVNAVPAPTRLCTLILPPCMLTSSCTRANPIPLPSCVRRRAFSMRRKRSNKCGISCSGIPVPVSRMTSSAWSDLPVSRTAIDPSNVDLRALEIRLRTIFSHISWSTYAG